MKKIKTYYWICTGLLIASLSTGSIFDIIMHPGAIEPLTKLGFPAYIGPFLGVARLLALAAIVIPGYPTIREWAYAGLTFDVLGAMYSLLASGFGITGIIFPLLTLLTLTGSYRLNHKMQARSTIAIPA